MRMRVCAVPCACRVRQVCMCVCVPQYDMCLGCFDKALKLGNDAALPDIW